MANKSQMKFRVQDEVTPSVSCIEASKRSIIMIGFGAMPVHRGRLPMQDAAASPLPGINTQDPFEFIHPMPCTGTSNNNQEGGIMNSEDLLAIVT